MRVFDMKKIYPSIIPVLLLIFAILISSCCIDDPDVINVDLNNTQTGIIQVSPDEEDIIYFGFDLRLGPKEDAAIYAPFLEYLSRETGRQFRIHFTPEYESTLDNLGENITQFAILEPISYLKAHEKYGVICLVNGGNTEGQGAYRSAIVTRPDSNITQIKDLSRKTFCFGSFSSTRGHLIPRKMLEDENIRLQNLKKYTYTGSHSECAAAVISGEYDAGGIEDTLAISLQNEGKLRIIAFSDYYPSSGISANKDVDPALREAVKEALIRFDPKGEDAKNQTKWNKTEMPYGFFEVNDSDYSQLRELAVVYEIIEQDVVKSDSITNSTS
jgi:phosphonate transport system substrate-binding protein